jgi:selenocysteine lyase/cysteine desulfurase
MRAAAAGDARGLASLTARHPVTTLDPPMIHLNHAGTSWPKPPPVHEAVAASLAASPDTWAAEIETHHRAVCRAFCITDPDRLLVTPGATSALAIAITDHPWERGDRVVISAMEHHAVHRPAQQLTARGVELVVVPRAADGPLCLDTLRTELGTGRVRLVAVSWASNVTGELLPLAEIIETAHAHGARVVVDAAQTAGWIPIDLSRLGADLLAFTGHKGLQAPWGVGGLYVAPHVSMRSPQAVCEIPAAAGPCAPMPGYCDAGTINRPALAGLASALAWLDRPDAADRLERVRDLAAELADAAAALPGCIAHGVTDPGRRLPTLALTFDAASPGGAAAVLSARGISASAGLQCAPLAHESLGTAPGGVLRLSLGPSTRADDVTVVIDALRHVAA